MTDVVILGAGGFARETYWVFLQDNEEKKKWNVLGFVDDNPKLHGAELCNIPVLGGFDWLEQNSGKNFEVICGVGNPRSRKAIAGCAANRGFKFCTLVHPNARMSRWVELGAGTIVAAGAILTTQIKIGPHTIVNFGTTVGHDTSIGAYCNISPGCHISGCVKFGDGVEFGTGAVIIHGRSIGDWSVIGAGAAVGIDVPSHVTAVGVPCRVIKNHQFESSIAVRS
jgi:sugar O-acyltransferase (sialic acid O-acetyltransferase NeuD family)